MSREKYMGLMTTTPFGQRPVTAVLMKRAHEAQAQVSVDSVDKWSLLRDLCTARQAFQVSDRDLAVLNALLSFFPGTELGQGAQLVVYPSNRSLAERAHGMAESTLRRHLAALCQAGLIQRNDSPNGKRYAHKDADGTVELAFGFDLRPLLVRAEDIARAACAARDTARRMKRLRSEISVVKRDALKLAAYGQEQGIDGDWPRIDGALLDLHREGRRKLSEPALEALLGHLKALLADVHSLLETEEMSGNDINCERQYQSSKPDSFESEPCQEKQDAPSFPLALIRKACPHVLDYSPDPVRHWHQLVGLAGLVRGMMGISPDAWTAAQTAMGPKHAAIVVAAILQRVDHIQSPGGYLRALTRKAEEGAFSPGPMIMALLRAES